MQLAQKFQCAIINIKVIFYKTILKFAFNWYSVASLRNSLKNVYDIVT